MNIPFIKKQIGFTLVELLVVMLILTALASVTLDFTKDFAFQGRYEVTKDRYEKVKRAIIGRPDVLINGQPDISGFVADMGRLPRNIQELLVQNYCSDDYRVSNNTPNSSGITDATGATPKEWCTSKTPNGVWHTASCTDATKTTQATCEAASETWSVWDGPYLTTQNPDYKANAISDGWGNEATELTDHNYGWEVCLGASVAGACYTSSPVINSGDLIILSKGKDQAVGGTGIYDLDYPAGLSTSSPSINNADWTVDIASLQAVVPTPSNGECLNAVCSDPVYGVYTNCLQPRSDWRIGVCSVDPSINTSSGLCASVSGAWTPIGICTVDPLVNVIESDCTTALGVWAIGICSNPLNTTQVTCEQARASWLGCDTSPSTNLTKTACDTALGNWESAHENNCQKGGGLWTSTRNVCFKVTRNSTSYYSANSSITEDSQNHLINYGTAQRIPIGNISVGIYPSDDAVCDANDDDVTYPAICINTGTHANFTQANCETHNGQWLVGATPAESSCSNMGTGANGVLCTGITGPQLGGTWSNKDQLLLKLVPNATLPIINW